MSTFRGKADVTRALYLQSPSGKDLRSTLCRIDSIGKGDRAFSPTFHRDHDAARRRMSLGD
jgi:hypothetical protein